MKEIIRLFKYYCLIDIYRLIRDLIITRLTFSSKVRIIRQPAYIVGKKYITFGANFNSGTNLRIEALDKHFVRHPIKGFEGKPRLIIGDNVSFNNNVHIGVIKKITLGNNVLIGSNVLIIDHNHGNYKGNDQDNPKVPPKDRKSIPQEIVIGDNVWISENVSILPGSIIGDGCIIGANTVISGCFKENQIIGGSPAKVLKKYNSKTNTWERIK